MTSYNPKDVAGGLILGAIGLSFFAGSFQMRVGTAAEMGPGYFPMVFGLLTICLGLYIALRGIGGRYEKITLAWRSFAAVAGSIAGFALIIERFGLIPAVAVTVLVGALGDRSTHPIAILILAVALSALSFLIFIIALGLPIPAFRRIF